MEYGPDKARVENFLSHFSRVANVVPYIKSSLCPFFYSVS